MRPQDSEAKTETETKECETEPPEAKIETSLVICAKEQDASKTYEVITRKWN